MTLEEATEVLLENRPFITCPTCWGTGRIPGHGITFACLECGKEGKVLDARYKEARRVLKLQEESV